METQTQTQMTKPPTDQTKMLARKGPRMVKVYAMRTFRIEDLVKDSEGKVIEDNSKLVKPGEVVEVTEKRARELIKPILGAYAFSGERYIADGDTPRHDLTIARLATKKDVVPKAEEPLTPLGNETTEE